MVDHHASNERYGTINVIDPDAAASGVLVRRLVAELGLPLTRDAAVCLYAALVCDTGRFQYESTTLRGVRARAASSPRFDLPIAELSRTLFEEHRFAYLQARRRRARRAPSSCPRSSFVWAKVTQADLERRGVTFEEVEGLIDLVRRTREAEVSCVLKEAADGAWRVSLRSLGAVDVCRIAAGARAAAGTASRPASRATTPPTSSSSASSTSADPRSRWPSRPVMDYSACTMDWWWSTSRRRTRRTTSSRGCARSTGSGASATRARSIPTRPACCSSGSAGRRACMRYLQDAGKSYRARIVFGVATDTLDASGAVLERGRDAARRESRSSTRRSAFVGDIEQIPPMVSAIKVDGRKLYELARAGETVERAPRARADRRVRGRGVRRRRLP